MKTTTGRTLFTATLVAMFGSFVAPRALAVPVTDPNDPRSFLGATVGTFAQLYFGSDTAATRQQVVDAQLLDDGIFDPTGYVAATLLPTPWALGTGGSGNHNAGGARGYSLDSTGVGGFDYVADNSIDLFTAGNSIDEKWYQSSNVVGETVYDLGGLAGKAAVFNTIDHGPLPQEAIESSVSLSNDLIAWTPASVERVWLEGWKSNTGIQWDGFVYAVGTGTSDVFRYVSVVWGGPGALQADGDNEINGLMGLDPDFTPISPEPSSAVLAACGWGALASRFRRRRA